MKVVFIGHSRLDNISDLNKKIKNTIMENIEDNKITFYCGGYGDFDRACLQVCHSIKKELNDCEIVFITPYITKSQQTKLKYLMDLKVYDSIVYPPLEKIPFRFAIIKRNEWMVEKADLIIAYVDHTYGGAYKALSCARAKKKRIINLAEIV